MLVPLRLAQPERVSDRLERRDVRIFVTRVGDAQHDVDVRLRRKAGDGRAADVFDRRRHWAERVGDVVPQPLEDLGPRGVVRADRNDARYVADIDEQKTAYEAANAELLEFLPGIPLAHPVPSLAFKDDVKGYPASPVQDEVYNVITLGD